MLPPETEAAWNFLREQPTLSGECFSTPRAGRSLNQAGAVESQRAIRGDRISKAQDSICVCPKRKISPGEEITARLDQDGLASLHINLQRHALGWMG